MKLIFDAEANGLDDATQVHCIVTADIDSKKLRRWHSDPKLPRSGTLEDGLEYMSKAEQLIGHNVLGYDMGLLQRLHSFEYPLGNWIDTEVLARCVHPGYSNQSLDFYGKLSGILKPHIDGWDEFTPEVLNRCVEDVKINFWLWNHLVAEGKKQRIPLHKIRLELDSQEILNRQRERGFPFNEARAYGVLDALGRKINPMLEGLQKTFPPRKVKIKTVIPFYKKDGTLSKRGLGFLGEAWKDVTGPVDKFEMRPFNPGSSTQKIYRLKQLGWEPTEFTEKGQPKTGWEAMELASKKIPEAAQLAQYGCLTKVRSVLSNDAKKGQGWIQSVKEDGRIHGRCMCIGAKTHRSAHRYPGLGNIPARNEGAVCRTLFEASEGKYLVGADASGIQMRLLCHLINDPEYTERVVNGDVHTMHKEALEIESRDDAKTFIYAYILGASAPLVAAITACNLKEAKVKMKAFESRVPIAAARDRLNEGAKARGYIMGIDGVRIYVKKWRDALAHYLQYHEQLIMKWAMREIDRKYKPEQLVFVHDEWVFEVEDEESGKVLGRNAVKEIRNAGLYFDLKCPLDGEFKIGKNWGDVH